MVQPYIGGSFAPPLSDDKIAAYKSLAATASPQISDAMNVLLACVEHWWELPESTQNGKPHGSGAGNIVPLEDAHAGSLDPLIPWAEELQMYAALFEGIDPATDKPLRDAAHHLLWTVRELDLGREPMTKDRL